MTTSRLCLLLAMCMFFVACTAATTGDVYCATHADCNDQPKLYMQYWHSYCNIKNACDDITLCPERNDAVDCVCPLVPVHPRADNRSDCLLLSANNPNPGSVSLVCIWGLQNNNNNNNNNRELFSGVDRAICAPNRNTYNGPCSVRNGGYGSCTYACDAHEDCLPMFEENEFLHFKATQEPLAYCDVRANCVLGATKCYERSDGLNCTCPELSPAEYLIVAPSDVPMICSSSSDSAGTAGVDAEDNARPSECLQSWVSGWSACVDMTEGAGNAKCKGKVYGHCELISMWKQPLFWIPLSVDVFAKLVAFAVLFRVLFCCHNNNNNGCLVVLPLYRRVYLTAIVLQCMFLLQNFSLSQQGFRDVGSLASLSYIAFASAQLNHVLLFMLSMPSLSRKHVIHGYSLGLIYAYPAQLLVALLFTWAFGGALRGDSQGEVGSFGELVTESWTLMLNGAYSVHAFWLVYAPWRWFMARNSVRESVKPFLYCSVALDLMVPLSFISGTVMALMNDDDDLAAQAERTHTYSYVLLIFSMLCFALVFVLQEAVLLYVMKKDTEYWRGMLFLKQGNLPNLYRDLHQRVRAAQEGDEHDHKKQQHVSLLTASESAASEVHEILSEHTAIDFTELRLGKLLGAGAFARVYQGMYRGCDTVAVKVLQSEEITEVEIRAFAAEVRVSVTFEHINVLKTYGICVCPPDLSIVQEFCGRGTLQENLENVRDMSWSRKLSLMLQIGRGLEYLHGRGCVHRDVKPDNILIADDWTMKVADFGLTRWLDERAQEEQKGAWWSGWCARVLVPDAKMSLAEEEEEEKQEGGRRGTELELWLSSSSTDKKTASSSSSSSSAVSLLRSESLLSASNDSKLTKFVGTPAYCAPEVSAGSDRYDGSVDVFALALLLWQMATGREDPWPGMMSSWDVRDAIDRDERPAVSAEKEPAFAVTAGCPAAFVGLLQRMWHRDPTQRPAMTMVVQELSSFAAQASSQDRKNQQ